MFNLKLLRNKIVFQFLASTLWMNNLKYSIIGCCVHIFKNNLKIFEWSWTYVSFYKKYFSCITPLKFYYTWKYFIFIFQSIFFTYKYFCFWFYFRWKLVGYLNKICSNVLRNVFRHENNFTDCSRIACYWPCNQLKGKICLKFKINLYLKIRV